MAFLGEEARLVVLIVHILSVLVGVGAVTVTDYLHIIGLKNRKIERKLLIVYPLLGQMIIGALVVIILTGGVLLANSPVFLSKKLFQLKLFLVGVIIINGIFLHKKVFPEMKGCVEGVKKYCSKKVLFISALCGSISIVTWYAIVILTLTKQYEYSPITFFAIYVGVMFFTFLIALIVENSQRKWY